MLKPLSDLEFQRKAWIDNFGEVWDSYAEVYMTFFEIAEPITADSEGYQLTDVQFSHLKKLQEMMDKLDDEIPDCQTRNDYEKTERCNIFRLLPKRDSIINTTFFGRLSIKYWEQQAPQTHPVEFLLNVSDSFYFSSISHWKLYFLRSS